MSHTPISNVKTGIVSFQRPEIDVSCDLTGGWDETRDDGFSADANLGNFLARPVKIAEIISTAIASPTYDTTIDPWNLFLTETSVRKRVEGYRGLQGNLHIKIVVSGNPWLMGLGIAAYIPRSTADNFYQSTNFSLVIAKLSMLPCIYIYPSTSEAGQIDVPFLNPDNWIDLIGGTYTSMGNLRVKSISNLTQLAGLDTSMQISIFAYMSNVRLVSPTSSNLATYVAQAGEYKTNGLLSKPMSTIATVASWFSNIPEIAPYAMATQMVATALGEAARLFGYSRPLLVHDIIRAKSSGCGYLAATDFPEALQKLSVDSKQELCVDPRTVGLAPIDEMMIPYICGKPCYVCTFNWDNTIVDGTALRYMNVTPCMHLVNTTPTPDEIQLTPMFTVASMFRFWRGSIRYHFRMNNTALHRGVLKINYDPYVVSAGTAYNLNYTRLVDISGINEFTFDVSWNSTRGWLLVDTACIPSVLPNHNNPAVDALYHNGSICISVVNALTSPDSFINRPVEISCFVSALDDIEFADPCDDTLSFTEYYPQSGELESMVEQTVDPIAGKLNAHSTKVYFGESFSSVRLLLKRYCYHSSIQTGANFQGWWREFNFPYYNGQRATLNRHTATGPIPYNYASMTHINWLVPCYIGWRGGLRSKFIPINNNGYLSVRRVGPGLHSNVSVNGIATSTGASNFGEEMLRIHRPSFTGAGAAAVSCDGSLEVEFPFSSFKRFAHGRAQIAGNASTYLTGDNEMHLGFVSQNTSNSRGTIRYVSTADDFSLFFFVGQPVICYRTPLSSGTAVTLPNV